MPVLCTETRSGTGTQARERERAAAKLAKEQERTARIVSGATGVGLGIEERVARTSDASASSRQRRHHREIEAVNISLAEGRQLVGLCRSSIGMFLDVLVHVLTACVPHCVALYVHLQRYYRSR